jgi:hypothetical protein
MGEKLWRPERPKTWWARALLWPLFDWRTEPVASVDDDDDDDDWDWSHERLPRTDKVTEPSVDELLKCPATQRKWDDGMYFVAEVFWTIVLGIFHGG